MSGRNEVVQAAPGWITLRGGGVMTSAQVLALVRTCHNYRVPFDPEAFSPAFDLPDGYMCGWIGTAIYVGVSPNGEVSS